MHPTFNQTHTQLGFTLVELVVVITVTAILAAGATLFIRNPTQAYFDMEARAALSDRADSAQRRMARDIRNALPNSVRTTVNGADSFIEFVPVKAAGRYRAEVGTSVTDNPLDFSISSDTFDVLGPSVAVASGDKLVIYNLGIPGSDVYEGSNIRALNTTGSLTTLSFTGGNFPQASPSSRFYIVNSPTSYACDMTNRTLVIYTGYAIQATQPASITALNALATGRQLANNLSTCQINYVAGVLQRSGIVTIYLGFTQESANVALMHQVNVINSP